MAKNLIQYDPPSKKFHNRTDANNYALQMSDLSKLQGVQFVLWPITVAMNVKKETKKFMKWNASFMASACQFLMLLE